MHQYQRNLRSVQQRQHGWSGNAWVDEEMHFANAIEMANSTTETVRGRERAAGQKMCMVSSVGTGNR
jgi:hypothetical protein